MNIKYFSLLFNIAIINSLPAMNSQVKIIMEEKTPDSISLKQETECGYAVIKNSLKNHYSVQYFWNGPHRPETFKSIENLNPKIIWIRTYKLYQEQNK